MKENILERFLNSLRDKLVFKIGIWEDQILPEIPENYSDLVSVGLDDSEIGFDLGKIQSGKRSYSKYVSNYPDISDLIELKSEVLIYLRNLYSENPKRFDEKVNPFLKQLARFQIKFIDKNIEKQFYKWHHNIEIEWDQSYFQYYQYIDSGGFNELSEFDYHEISQRLIEYKEFIESTITELSDLSRQKIYKPTISMTDASKGKESEINQAFSEILSSVVRGVNRIEDKLLTGDGSPAKVITGVNGFQLIKSIDSSSIDALFLFLFPNYIDAKKSDFFKLVNGGFFSKAYSIKWTVVTRKKEISYRPLIYFLKSALFENEPDKADFVNRVMYIFSDKSGLPFKRKNFVENYRQYEEWIGDSPGTLPDWQVELDYIISAMLPASNP